MYRRALWGKPSQISSHLLQSHPSLYPFLLYNNQIKKMFRNYHYTSMKRKCRTANEIKRVKTANFKETNI
jgi:hypothetical protein